MSALIAVRFYFYFFLIRCAINVGIFHVLLITCQSLVGSDRKCRHGVNSSWWRLLTDFFRPSSPLDGRIPNDTERRKRVISPRLQELLPPCLPFDIDGTKRFFISTRHYYLRSLCDRLRRVPKVCTNSG